MARDDSGCDQRLTDFTVSKRLFLATRLRAEESNKSRMKPALNSNRRRDERPQNSYRGARRSVVLVLVRKRGFEPRLDCSN